MVAEAGGLAALAPHPGRPEAEKFSRLDFVQRHAPQADPARQVGRPPGRRRPPHRRVRPLGAHRGVGLGGRLQHRAHPHRPAPGAPGELHRRRGRLAGRHQGPADLGVGRAPGPGHRLAGHRATRRAAGQHPQRRPGARRAAPTPWSSRSAWSTGTASAAATSPRCPPPYAELVRRHVAVAELHGRGRAATGDRSLAGEAFFLDPLAGRGDLHQTEAMVDELLAGTARVAPAVRRTIRRTDPGRGRRTHAIGFIGLGAMGLPMTRHLLEAGHQVTVASRSRGPIDAGRRARGRSTAARRAGVAEASEIVILCVPSSPAGGRGGRRHAARPSARARWWSTARPSTPRWSGPSTHGSTATGAGFLDAPLSGRHGRGREGDAHPDGRGRRRPPWTRSGPALEPFAGLHRPRRAGPGWARWSSSATT